MSTRETDAGERVATAAGTPGALGGGTNGAHRRLPAASLGTFLSPTQRNEIRPASEARPALTPCSVVEALPAALVDILAVGSVSTPSATLASEADESISVATTGLRASSPDTATVERESSASLRLTSCLSSEAPRADEWVPLDAADENVTPLGYDSRHACSPADGDLADPTHARRRVRNGITIAGGEGGQAVSRVLTEILRDAEPASRSLASSSAVEQRGTGRTTPR